jgi:hypothetical protein
MTTAKVLTNNCGFPLFGTRSVQRPMPAAATVNIFPTASLASVLAFLLLFEGICWVDFQKRFQERASRFDQIGEQLDRKRSARPS